MDANAAVCLNCGFQKENGNKYCANCGNEVVEGASVCVKCGCTLTEKPTAGCKSKLVAGLLGIFLGAFGVHNFYLGYKGKAIAQLLISLLTCGFGAFASSIWGLIEGIMILAGKINKDGKGNALCD